MVDSRIGIIVVGAGISGLACARQLSAYKNRIHLTVLEASDKIGGRIRSIKSDDGTTLELGAQFIHGTIHNPIYDFMVDNKLILKDTKEGDKSYREDITCFTKKLISSYSHNELIEGLKIGKQHLEEVISGIHTLSDEEISKYKSLGGYMFYQFNVILDKYGGDKKLYDIIKSVFLYWISFERVSSGCTKVTDLDIKGFRNYIDLGGDLLFSVSQYCQNGYADLVNTVANEIDNDDILLNHEVNRIEHVFIDCKSKVKVSCSNGKVFLADAVIFTVSVGVLKYFIKIDVFDVELPDTKLSSISKLCLSNVIRVLFKFVLPVDDKVRSFQFYPSPETDLLDFGEHDYLLHFARQGDSDWWVYELVCEPDFHLNDPFEYLTNLINRVAESHPDFPANKIDEDTIIVSNWGSKKYFRGSYSYQKPGTDGRDVKNLAEPVTYSDTHLLFAGEATDEHYYGTVHGAYLSGIREAENIKNIYELN